MQLNGEQQQQQNQQLGVGSLIGCLDPIWTNMLEF